MESDTMMFVELAKKFGAQRWLDLVATAINELANERREAGDYHAVKLLGRQSDAIVEAICWRKRDDPGNGSQSLTYKTSWARLNS